MKGITPATIPQMSLFFSLKLLLYTTYPMIIKAKINQESTEKTDKDSVVEKIKQ